MVSKFLWGVTWRTLAFFAVAGAGLWYANRPPSWNGDDIIAAGDTKIEGKAGVVVVALMQPERFDPKFFDNFVDKLVTQVIPWPVNVLAGADSGIVLVDPTQPYMVKRYSPKKLADIWGREADVDGTPWIQKYRRGELRWQKPSSTTPHDPGVFIYPERKQGMRFAAAKTSAKARYVYYPTLPGGVLPHYAQTRAMTQGAIDLVKARYPIVAGEVADAFDPYAKEQAIFRVLDAGADTIVLASAQPVYSKFEELEGSFVGVYKSIEKWRTKHGNKPIKIVIPPYMASQKAYDDLMMDHLDATTPKATAPGQKAMAIVSLHGLPPSLAKTDSWTARTKEVEKRLAPRMIAVMKAKGYATVEAHFASEGFADTLEDPDNEIVSVRELWDRARNEGFAVANAVPIEFLAENTDTLFAHAAIMFDGLPGYRTYQGPPADVDWSKPYVRRFQLGNMLAVYAGAPGSATIPRQSTALADAISVVLAARR
jgi:protoheme ferro-lyase